MNLTEETLDDLLNNIYKHLLNCPFEIETSRGLTSESIGNNLVLRNPRARISRTETRGKVFSALGELLWYLKGTRELDFIKYFIPAYEGYKELDESGNEIIFGGYGPRIMNMRGHNQLDNIINTLRKSPNSRRAIIQLFNAEDLIGQHIDIPCTCYLQFLVRDCQVHLYTSMRSNDAYMGLPHDIFCFTMLQELVARSLGLELGKYYHAVGSLHLYKKNIAKVKSFIEEGWQSTKHFMPSMPDKDPWNDVRAVLKLESEIRANTDVNFSQLAISDYWKDIVRLIQIHSLIKNDNIDQVDQVISELSDNVYSVYIKERVARK